MMLTLVPAYGRDYKSVNAVREDFGSGKDFLIQDISSQWDNKYCSIRELKKDYTAVKIRYNKLTRVVIIQL